MKILEYKKLGFSLSGGGAKGCFQAGALYYILTQKLTNYRENIHAVSGTSVGALNGIKIAELGSGYTFIDGLKDIWYSIKSPDDVMKKRFWGIVGIVFGADSYADSSPLRKLVATNIDFDAIKRSRIHFSCTAYNTRTRQIKYFNNQDSKLLDAIIASCSIPGIFNPVKIDTDYWLDGGVREISPIKPLIEQECDLIIAIRCSPSQQQELPKHPSGISLMNSVISSLVNEIYNNDLDKFQFINEFIEDYHFLVNHLKVQGYYESQAIKLTIEKLEKVLSKYRYIDLIVVEPKLGELQVETVDFTNDKIKHGFNLGVNTAKDVFSNYKLIRG